MPSPKLLINSHQRLGLGLHMFFNSLCRALAIGVFICAIFYLFLFYYPTFHSERFSEIKHIVISFPPTMNPLLQRESEIPTDLRHIIFGLLGSTRAWKDRRNYTETWWKPNVTRGYLFLDKPPTKDLLPWPKSSPPYRVSENNSELLKITHQNDTMVRIARGLLETFREGDKGVRWIMMGDDDSLFFLENIVEVLRRYDHNKYVYIGGHSETAMQDYKHSYDMGFGGAGVIFSYTLAMALVPRLDDCLMRYPQLDAADQIWQSCLADMGVYMNHEKGIHQVDLRGDISGFLSAHPQAPLLSLHHPGAVQPYFPKMDRHNSVTHLMKAANVDQSRLLQQTICYDRGNHWSFSVSWGYSVHIYENIYSRSILQKPLETFNTWVGNVRRPFFIFNTRVPKVDTCETPHVFYMESVKRVGNNQVCITYKRVAQRWLATCKYSNNSANKVFKIRIFSPMEKLKEVYGRECCEVLRSGKKSTAVVKYRDCLKNEVIG